MAAQEKLIGVLRPPSKGSLQTVKNLIKWRNNSELPTYEKSASEKPNEMENHSTWA